MNVIKFLTDALAELTSKYIELERKYATVEETAHFWNQKHEEKNAECTDLTARLKEATAEADHWLQKHEKIQDELLGKEAELEEAKEKLKALEEYIKEHEKGAQA